MKKTKLVKLDHVSLNVRDLRGARAFYQAAFGPIGMKINMDVGSAFGMGSQTQKVFWLSRDKKAVGGTHFAFSVDHRDEVDAFYDAAIAAGGNDNGGPGLRPNYGRNYYAAFVRDPEGNNIEVVCYVKGPARSAAKKTAKARASAAKTRAGRSRAKAKRTTRTR